MTMIYFERVLSTEDRVAVCRALFDAAHLTEEAQRQRGLRESFDVVLPGINSPIKDSDIWENLATPAVLTTGKLDLIGYLDVKLIFDEKTLDVTFFESKYGISAKTVLEKTNIKCIDNPMNSTQVAVPMASTPVNIIFLDIDGVLLALDESIYRSHDYEKELPSVRAKLGDRVGQSSRPLDVGIERTSWFEHPAGQSRGWIKTLPHHRSPFSRTWPRDHCR